MSIPDAKQIQPENSLFCLELWKKKVDEVRALAKKEKKLCALHELGNKMQLGVCMGHCELLSGLIVGPGGKPLENIQYLDDKEIIK